MLRIMLREILIFLVCIAILPTAVFVLLLQTDSPERVARLLIRVAAGSGISPLHDPLAIWTKVLAPYALVQAVRAYFWAQRSVTGRRWANLYFLVVLLFGAGTAFVDAWGILYIIYAVGDLPEGLVEFVKLEFKNTVIFTVCIGLAVYCAGNVLRPGRRDSSER